MVVNYPPASTDGSVQIGLGCLSQEPMGSLIRCFSDRRLTICVMVMCGLALSACDGEGPLPPLLPASVDVTPATDTLFAPGETAQLIAIAKDAQGNSVFGVSFTWSSSDDGIATVSSTGLVTAVAVGTAAITATADGVSGTATIVVVPPFVFGVNWPWVKYGLDAGESGFGVFGLSSDCSEGFRPERFPGSHGVTHCGRSQEQVRSGSFSLKACVDIAGADPDRPPNGEVTTDLHDIAHVPKDFSVDLDWKTITGWVYVSPGNRGDPSKPNFFQIFVKDNSREASGLYSDAFNIPAAGGWIKLALTVHPQTGFDPSHIRLVGVKVGIGGGSSAKLTDCIYIDQIESPFPDVTFDFEDPSRAAIDVAQLTDAGVQVFRWFMFADGRASPEFDAQGYVTGLDEAFMRDFEELLQLARDYQFQIMPVLFDFLLCGDPDEFNGVPLFGRADLIRDPGRWQSFLMNAMDPLLQQYGQAPEIYAWEIMNEPEWCISDLEPPLENPRPAELPADGAVTTAEMQAFAKGIADFIHDYPGTGGARVTLGSASYRYVQLWDEIGLDLFQFHYYNCDGCLDMGRDLPVNTDGWLLGEFAALESATSMSVFKFFEHACAGGYAGAMPWSWRGRDEVSPVGAAQQQNLLDDIMRASSMGLCAGRIVASR